MPILKYALYIDISTKFEDKSNNILLLIYAQYMHNECTMNAQYMHNTCTILINLGCIHFAAELTLCIMNYLPET